MSRLPPNRSPKPDQDEKPKPLEQSEADFTSEGAPPPGKVGKRGPAVAATPVDPVTPVAPGRKATPDVAIKPSAADPERSAERSS